MNKQDLEKLDRLVASGQKEVIEQWVCDYESKLTTMENNQALVQQNYIAKDKEIVLAECEKRDLRMSLSKNAAMIKELKSDLRILNTKKWMKSY